MAFTKFKELKVKHGTYKASDGTDKPSWSTVGRIMHDDTEDRYSVYIHPDRLLEAVASLQQDNYGYVRLAAFDPRPDAEKDKKKFQKETKEYFSPDKKRSEEAISEIIDDQIPF